MKRETRIENGLLRNIDSLGYKNAVPIRNVVLVPETGRADVILLPESGLHRLVIIEVKQATARDAPDKVVGQLMRYYSQALTLGISAIEKFREYAIGNPERATGIGRVTPRMVFGVQNSKVSPILCEGRRLRSEEVALYVAFDGEISDVLKQIITVLNVHHKLPIGAIHSTGKRVHVLVGGSLTQRQD